MFLSYCGVLFHVPYCKHLQVTDSSFTNSFAPSVTFCPNLCALLSDISDITFSHYTALTSILLAFPDVPVLANSSGVVVNFCFGGHLPPHSSLLCAFPSPCKPLTINHSPNRSFSPSLIPSLESRGSRASPPEKL